MKTKLLNLIKEHHLKTGGKSGLTVVSLSNLLNAKESEIKPLLNNLYKEKKILVRNGLNNKLVFLRKD